MRRIFILLVVLFTSITTFLLTNNQAFAKTSDDSATLMRLQTPTNREADGHVKILRAFLKKYNSPLADYAPVFIQEADKNNLDWKLVASICGVESYFGQQIPYNSYNGWGFGVYGDHVLRFTSWDQGISTVSQSL